MDIISFPVEFDNKKYYGRFGLVNIAAQRAKDIAAGSMPRIDSRSTKVATIAIEETIEGKVDFLIGEEAVKAKEEAKKLDYRKLLEEKKRDSEKEELTELEKDLKIYLHEKEGSENASANDIFKEEEGAAE
ncbi:DNA-directed RNA polymerase subunit omega [bacterium BMS3Abin07]|nr:DNA-directed RNA polymerase subunit omega [bacterium BMS3Abin07]GBE33456.1 DNA-directed RNA polymerase subunit omega [bacterium BMS3Bbin05]HDO22738.1 DNA-directed RNA polymerase subunit omega [Nitrospirota bacterium]